MYMGLLLRGQQIFGMGLPHMCLPPDSYLLVGRTLLLPSGWPFHPCLLLVALGVVFSLLSFQAVCPLSRVASHSHPYHIGYEQDTVSLPPPFSASPKYAPFFISILQIKWGKQKNDKNNKCDTRTAVFELLQSSGNCCPWFLVPNSTGPTPTLSPLPPRSYCTVKIKIITFFLIIQVI